MKPQIKAYSYVRMSTDIQLKGDSLRRQKESSKKYAEENNLELIETLQDIGISAFSGKNSKDGALGVFIEAIESNKIEAGSYLLVESLDRLSRDDLSPELRTKYLDFIHRATESILTKIEDQ